MFDEEKLDNNTMGRLLCLGGLFVQAFRESVARMTGKEIEEIVFRASNGSIGDYKRLVGLYANALNDHSDMNYEQVDKRGRPIWRAGTEAYDWLLRTTINYICDDYFMTNKYPRNKKTELSIVEQRVDWLIENGFDPYDLGLATDLQSDRKKYLPILIEGLKKCEEGGEDNG